MEGRLYLNGSRIYGCGRWGVFGALHELLRDIDDHTRFEGGLLL